MSKKICVLTTVDITQSSFIIPAMREFRKHGWDITVICNMTSEFIRAYENEFRLINIPFHRGISIKDCICQPFALAKLFKHEKFDIVQYATPNAALYSSIGAWIAKVPHRVYCQWGIRYIGSHGIMRLLLKCIERITCAASTAIRPASKKNMEFSVSEGLYPICKAKVIGNGGTIGIDFTQFRLDDKTNLKSIVLEEYPQLKNKFVFAFVGRMNREKGIIELIEAFMTLHKRGYTEIALLLIGDFDGELPKHIYDINNDLIIQTGWKENVPQYISMADVLVHPSYREGFSMVIQQAMAMAIPVITTDIPGPSEVIEPGVSGITVKPCNTIELCNAMEWMIKHPIESTVMGRAGRKRCENLFQRSRMLQLTLEDRENIIRLN